MSNDEMRTNVTQPSPSTRPHNAISLLEASHNDLDALTSILLSAFAADPIWQYQFAHASEYPDDHRTVSQTSLQHSLDAASAGYCKVLKVIEQASDESSNHLNSEIVAFAIFSLPGTHEKSTHPPSAQSPSPDSHRRDADPQRLLAFQQASLQGKQHLYEKYGENQIRMVWLATHRDHWGKGAGTLLCEWGLAEARRRRLALTTLATTMGKELYLKMGLELLTTVRIQVEGEEYGLDYAVMGTRIVQ